MAVVAVAFAAGILAGDRFGLAGCALVAASAALLGLLMVPAQRRATLLLVAAVVVCGALRYAADRSVAPDDVSRFCRQVRAIEGTVASDIGGAPDSRRLSFRVSRARVGDKWRAASGDVMVTMYLAPEQSLPRLEYGDRLRLAVHPYIPYEPTNPGQFSWKNYLERHGIYCCASVRDRSRVTVLSKSSSHSIVRAAFAGKRYLVSSIYRIHSREVASVMSGVVLGTYAYLDDDTLRDFTRTGTLHVLAASGYNCLVLLIIASPLLRLLRVLPRYRWGVMVLLIALYLLMVGPVPSMLRAAVMAILVLLAAPFKRVPDYKNLFYVAAFLVLLFNPSHLFDIGFQLSFLAVLGLIAVAPVLETLLEQTPLRGVGRRPRWRPHEPWLSRTARVRRVVVCTGTGIGWDRDVGREPRDGADSGVLLQLHLARVRACKPGGGVRGAGGVHRQLHLADNRPHSALRALDRRVGHGLDSRDAVVGRLPRVDEIQLGVGAVAGRAGDCGLLRRALWGGGVCEVESCCEITAFGS